jgi:hypothetical protein
MSAPFGCLSTRVMIVSLSLAVLLLAGWRSATVPRYGPHSTLDIWAMAGDRSEEDGLYVMYSTYFATAGRCSGCHGHDTMAQAMVDENGVDVNVTDDWRSTMMANSARDPFFRAKVSHEGLVDPDEQIAIENKCLSCHAPLGMHEERMLGHAPFNMAMLDTSVMGLEGVGCLACHQQVPDSAGKYFSGELQFGPEEHHNGAQIYGPYPDDEINADIMEFFVGFRPNYGEHIQDGRVCAGCHTLITETHDLDGNATGGEFVEQATWHEWKNSIYAADEEKTCRGCHMPRINDYIILASEYAFLPGHSPFGKHHLAGGNAFMLRMLKEYKEELGIPATDVQFDSTIARTLRMLDESVDLSVELIERTPDTMFVDVHALNLTGHKFPSGYPSRRAFVQFVVTDALGDTIFQSGRWDGTNEVFGHDAPYEPHYDVIRSGDEVQIYEMVMADVNGDVTTVLERADEPLKDNRLVPQGFSTLHYTYDTCVIAGVPASDTDFNHDALNMEGNGADIVHYHVPTNGYTGLLHVDARIYYQPVPPKWNQEMFSFNSAAIDTFRTMYENADGTPILIAADSLSDDRTSMNEYGADGFMLWPNPSADGVVHLIGEHIDAVRVYDVHGALVQAIKRRTSRGWSITLPAASGAYHLVVESRGRTVLKRVIRQ